VSVRRGQGSNEEGSNEEGSKECDIGTECKRKLEGRRKYNGNKIIKI
jgi:hypothetical protein